jgi:hypothetical protein
MWRRSKKHQLMISNEGIPVVIEWHKMRLGTSFFIPALDTEPLITQVVSAGKKRRIKLVYKEVVENGKIGIRFWRKE